MITLNQNSFNHAKQLIEEGKVTETPHWVAPSAEEEDAYIAANGYAAYGTWYLGIRSGEKADTKEAYAFPFTSDFKTLNAKSIEAIEIRASQYGYTDILDAAHQLKAMLKAKEGQ